jgi:hypothetical protein
MKALRQTLLATACAVAVTATAQAATVAFEYTDPADFRDIRATDTSQQRFQARVLHELEDQFRREATALPEDQTLHVTLKDVDLAGEIEYFYRGYPFGLRVIRNVDSPSVAFSYELRDAEGSVLQTGEEKIRDVGFRFTTLMPLDRSPFRYEKALISEWYDESF